MARMIDIDDVERILWDHHFHDGDGLQALCDVAEILVAVRGHPGVVDIVRCKECVFWLRDEGHGPNGECDCGCNGGWWLPEDYCSCGERREADADTP